MNAWVRLGRYVWRYRRQVVLSTMFGLGAALLWSAELLLTFPVVTVFVEGQSLDEYVLVESETAQRRLEAHRTELEQVNGSLAQLPAGADDRTARKRMRLLKEQSQLQARVDDDAWRLWSLSWVATRILPWLPRGEFQLLMALFGVLIVVTALKGVCVYVQDLTAGSVAELCVLDLRTDAFRKLLQRDAQSIEGIGPPKLLANLTYDLQGLAHGLTTLGGRVVREPLKAVACLATAFFINWQLTALSLVFVPLAAWAFHVLGRRLKRAVHRVLDTMARMYKFLEQTFANIRVVHAYDMQGPLRREFHRQNRDFYRQSLKIVKIDALTNPVTELFGVSTILFALLPGAYLLLRDTERIWGLRLTEGPIGVQELSTLYVALAGVIDPLRKFSKYFTTIKQCRGSLDRIFERLDEPSLVEQSATAVWLPPLRGTLEFRDVHFHYHGAEGRQAENRNGERTGVLHDVSLTVRAGEAIAVVGPNGSGKSTFLGLIPRFYDPTEGVVLLDGIDLRDGRLKDLRRQLALVSQETLLFDDTLLNNIRYGRPTATDEEVRTAAEQAYVTEFVDRFPEGWGTRVGERGRLLSGGQRQRVALARAILRDPRILLLDEPTAAIDALSERLIHESLARFTRGRTTLLITHQLGPAALDYIDRVVVFDRGQLIAAGSHADLRETCPIYRQLVGAPPRRAA